MQNGRAMRPFCIVGQGLAAHASKQIHSRPSAALRGHAPALFRTSLAARMAQSPGHSTCPCRRYKKNSDFREIALKIDFGLP